MPLLAAPAAPMNLSAVASSASQINLTWVDTSTSSSNAENGFKVERALSSSGPWQLVAITAANVTSYANAGLNPSTTYYYRFVAESGGGGPTFGPEKSLRTFPLPSEPSTSCPKA